MAIHKIPASCTRSRRMIGWTAAVNGCDVERRDEMDTTIWIKRAWPRVDETNAATERHDLRRGNTSHFLKEFPMDKIALPVNEVWQGITDLATWLLYYSVKALHKVEPANEVINGLL